MGFDLTRSLGRSVRRSGRFEPDLHGAQTLGRI
jgi:hypothetical protein